MSRLTLFSAALGGDPMEQSHALEAPRARELGGDRVGTAGTAGRARPAQPLAQAGQVPHLEVKKASKLG